MLQFINFYVYKIYFETYKFQKLIKVSSYPLRGRRLRRYKDVFTLKFTKLTKVKSYKVVFILSFAYIQHSMCCNCLAISTTFFPKGQPAL